MKGWVRAALLGCAVLTQAQNPFSLPAQSPGQDAVTASLLVRHLHEGGWDSHVIELRLTANALLLNGSQQFTNASGIVGGYCIFPAEIPLESIVNVQAVPGNRFVDAVKLFDWFARGVHPVPIWNTATIAVALTPLTSYRLMRSRFTTSGRAAIRTP